MLFVDYSSAFLLAVAFTILFGNAVRERKRRAWRRMPVSLWLLAASSWLIGVVLVGLGAVVTHWTTFIFGLLAFVVIADALIGKTGFKRISRMQIGDSRNDALPAITLYFWITLLLFFSAISVRSYIANLG